MAELKPSVLAVDIGHHGNETAVVLEGENLWFCHQVTVGGHHELLPAQKATASSIQFSIPRKDSAIIVEDEKVKVSLQSHFFKPINESTAANVEVSVIFSCFFVLNMYVAELAHKYHFSEPQEYTITTRQQQLAQLTPSKLIEMAYLCALLEQHPYSKSQPSSHKFKVIKTFLESVVHVVPLESLLYAIANSSSHDTAMSCFQALRSSKLDLPSSHLMFEGLRLAMYRMTQGISGYYMKQLEEKAKQHHLFDSTSVLVDSSEVHLSISPRVPGQQAPVLEVEHTTSIKREEIEFLPVTEESKDASKYLCEFAARVTVEWDQKVLSGSGKCLCGLDIDKLYPISHVSQQHGDAALRSPLSILISCRRKLYVLVEETQDVSYASVAPSPQTKRNNKKMLKAVNSIRRKDVDICINLLGAFMQQQEINIGLTDSKHGMLSSLSIKATASVGVWALFSLEFSHVQQLLARCKGNKLLVKIEDYIKGMSGKAPTDIRYAAKLQFIVQGMRKTVTCNSQYISYSLERQLVAVCKERKIDASIPLDILLKKWSGLFRDNTLSLVREYDRPLIARWLKWALMIHNLREELAKYTAIGVVGLVNSGKSKLINTLFGIQVCTETMCCFY